MYKKKANLPHVGDLFRGTVVNAYVVRVNSDLTEGRGVTVNHSYHLGYADAVEAARGADVMGSNGDVEDLFCVKTESGDVFELKPLAIALSPYKEKALREAALAKLTEEERELLGLREGS